MSDINFDKYGNEEFFKLFLAAVKESYGDYCTFKEHEENLTEYSEPVFEKSIEEAERRLCSIVQKLENSNEHVIDSIIEYLYKARWSGDLSDAPVSEMRDQLFKTLRDQTMGYWSGHTAYNIAVDGGFLINDKKGANKRLTSLGTMFVEQEQLRKEQGDDK